MGSILGPVYANTFMSKSEIDWLHNCPTEFKLLYYKRYVDDTFLIFKRKDDVDLFWQYMNKQHKNIKFTCETEKENCLPFWTLW